MEIIAKAKYIRVSPQKLRLIVRGLKKEIFPSRALAVLSQADKPTAKQLVKTLKQAISNATNNFSQKEENLRIKKIEIGEGPVYKRYQPISRGMAHPILKRMSHITVVLEGKEVEVKK
jgi:large subunit ribosomal protein L22